ncbi:hypothetical protein Glove_174g72 [Diversispora epigaea]|uniref:Uncharacterized protein n=1 Tax=Diversispora epigaea TaxID=1348612 RepID=A0A397IXX8_9GLOM|nr:hypothetical protein Glove_174g72 [Diversispora epigaea]
MCAPQLIYTIQSETIYYDFSPIKFYKKYVESFNSRKEAEADLLSHLKALSRVGKSKEAHKAQYYIKCFDELIDSKTCNQYWDYWDYWDNWDSTVEKRKDVADDINTLTKKQRQTKYEKIIPDYNESDFEPEMENDEAETELSFNPADMSAIKKIITESIANTTDELVTKLLRWQKNNLKQLHYGVQHPEK